MAALMVGSMTVLGITLVEPARADTHTYPGPAPCNTTLQACINGASPFDTIRLATNGNIDENLSIDKPLRLERAAGFTPTIGGSSTTRSVVLQDAGPASFGLVIHLRRLKLVNAELNVEFTAGTGHSAIIENSSIETPSGDGVELNLGVGSAVRISNNRIHANAYPIDAFVSPGGADTAEVIIESNRLSSPDPLAAGPGIALDFRGSSAAEADVFSNAIHRTSGCNCGGAVAIEVHAMDSVDADVNIVGNTIDNIQVDTAGIEIGYAGSPTIDARVFNNIITRVEGPAVDFPDSQVSNVRIKNGYNNFFNNDSPPDFGGYPSGPATLNLNPRYRQASTGNYRLERTSPLINRGLTCTPGGFSRHDAAFNSRLAGKSVDIGAYEFGARPVSGGSVYVGGAAVDNYVGGSRSDIFCGMGGRDSFAGLGGSDIGFGGGGADELAGGQGPDFLVGGRGSDELIGKDGRDLLRLRDGTSGNDTGKGGRDNDRCPADPGDTRLSC